MVDIHEDQLLGQVGVVDRLVDRQVDKQVEDTTDLHTEVLDCIVSTVLLVAVDIAVVDTAVVAYTEELNLIVLTSVHFSADCFYVLIFADCSSSSF